MSLPNLYRLSQQTDTPLQIGQFREFSWRYLYARSADSRAGDDSGQDYLTWAYDDKTWVFCLCDGVSQSFFGDLAARLLGDTLLEWLWSDLHLTLPSNQVQTNLTTLLQELVGPGTEHVHQYPIPPNLPDLLLQAMHQKQQHGSETTYVAGRLDLPRPDCPQGRLVLSWMGDSRLRLWDRGGEFTASLGETIQTRQRWSTRQGPVGGLPNLFDGPLVDKEGQPHFRYLLAYSDGLAIIDPTSSYLTTNRLLEMVKQANDDPTSDDISYLELWVKLTEGS